ncbi:glutathione S-transferase 1-like [Plutella xylostella]|uniref:glutathione S-transferase 1-like n=1 Tax=Plutella xylostella TaxID=51655 RepID=UPI0020326474|nr:glutathione S-transferase 1-like [Plutella xylostella]
MPAIDLYEMPSSAPCRAVRLTARALGVPVNLHLVDLMAGEHLKPEFTKINPQHTIPTIVDDGFTLWESRTIMRYLVNKYGKGTSLYPEEPKARALVDQRLDFDLGTLYDRYAVYFYPQIFGTAPENPELLKKLHEALAHLNHFLGESKYAAGPNLTIADLTLVVTVSTIDLWEIIDFKQYPNIDKWYEHLKSSVEGYEEENLAGLGKFRAFIKEFKAKKAAAK